MTPMTHHAHDGAGAATEVDLAAGSRACDRVDQGLQLRWRGRFRPCLPPALQRDPGESQARIVRNVCGQDGTGSGEATAGPPLSAAGSRSRIRLLWRLSANQAA